jgi:hypothetical protein
MHVVTVNAYSCVDVLFAPWSTHGRITPWTATK